MSNLSPELRNVFDLLVTLEAVVCRLCHNEEMKPADLITKSWQRDEEWKK